jgi:hypothetical protein
MIDLHHRVGASSVLGSHAIAAGEKGTREPDKTVHLEAPKIMK